MELISRQKVMNASLDYATKILNEGAEGCCTDISIDFREGVSFAETELAKLAIDFKLFCDKNKTDDTTSCEYFTQLLFDKFIKEREK